MPAPLAILGGVAAGGFALSELINLGRTIRGELPAADEIGVRAFRSAAASDRVLSDAAFRINQQQNDVAGSILGTGPDIDLQVRSMQRQQELASLISRSQARLDAMSIRSSPSPIEFALRMGAF